MLAIKIIIIKSFIISVLVLGLNNHAAAYLDPGTGMMIVQGIIAAFAAVVTTAGLYWGKIKSFFGGQEAETEGQEQEDQESGDSKKEQKPDEGQH